MDLTGKKAFKIYLALFGVVLLLLGATTTASGAGAGVGVPMALLGVAMIASAGKIKRFV